MLPCGLAWHFPNTHTHFSLWIGLLRAGRAGWGLAGDTAWCLGCIFSSTWHLFSQEPQPCTRSKCIFNSHSSFLVNAISVSL